MMKLSASNIAWGFEHDAEMFALLQSLGFHGLEIAPTRLFPNAPYDQLDEARAYAAALREQYGLAVSSMQSILFGVPQNLFASPEDRAFLLSYLQKACGFAEALGCGNLVFGCPKNRNIETPEQPGQHDIALAFFAELADCAAQHNTVISLEPNPVIYGTNFLNTTEEAFDFVREVNHHALKVNIDCGTILHNNEDLALLAANAPLIHHIHISEPNLVPVERRAQHKALFELPFSGYISLEMKRPDHIETVKEALCYIQSLAAN